LLSLIVTVKFPLPRRDSARVPKRGIRMSKKIATRFDPIVGWGKGGDRG
jgi:hypothetical protein